MISLLDLEEGVLYKEYTQYPLVGMVCSALGLLYWWEGRSLTKRARLTKSSFTPACISTRAACVYACPDAFYHMIGEELVRARAFTQHINNICTYFQTQGQWLKLNIDIFK